MKRLIPLLLSLLMLFSLAACGETAPQSVPAEAQTPSDLPSAGDEPLPSEVQALLELLPTEESYEAYQTPSDILLPFANAEDEYRTPSDLSAYARTPSDVAGESVMSMLEGELTVYAPEAIREAMLRALDAFEQRCPAVKVELRFADAAALKADRAAGGACDVFIGASGQELDALDIGASAADNPDRTNLVLEGTRCELAVGEGLYPAAVMKGSADTVLAMLFLDYLYNTNF